MKCRSIRNKLNADSGGNQISHSVCSSIGYFNLFIWKRHASKIMYNVSKLHNPTSPCNTWEW